MILAMVAKPTAAATTNEAQVANRCDLCKSSILSSIFAVQYHYTLDKDSPHHAWQTVKDAHLTLVPQDHRIQSLVEKVCFQVPLFVRVLSAIMLFRLSHFLNSICTVYLTFALTGCRRRASD